MELADIVLDSPRSCCWNSDRSSSSPPAPLPKGGRNQHHPDAGDEEKKNDNHPDNPCVIYHDNDNNDIDCNNGSKSHRTGSMLTFGDAQQSCRAHGQWLHTQILQAFPSLSSDGNCCTTPTPQENPVVVVAYLCTNSVDYLLSVLAGCDSKKQQKGDDDTNNNADAEQHNSHNRFTVQPALLNIRWTAAQVAQVLQTATSRENNNGNDNKKYCPPARTLIVYSPALAEVVQQTQSLLNHPCAAVPLPNLVQPRPFQTINRPFATSNTATTETPDTSTTTIPTTTPPSTRTALVLFTSGTTSGNSRGVELSHQAIAIQCWTKTQLCYNNSNSNISTIRLDASTVPIFHIGGLSSLLAVWMARGCLVFGNNSNNFAPACIWQSLADPIAPTTALVVVPTMLHALQAHYERALKQSSASSSSALVYCYPHVTMVLIGGQSATPAQIAFGRRVFPHARFVQTYACTEAASSVTFYEIPHNDNGKPPFQTTDRSGDCIGTPPEHVQVKLMALPPPDNASHNTPTAAAKVITTPGIPGVIATRGPHVMNGYWRRGRPTTSSGEGLDRDGWLITNDLATYGRGNGNLQRQTLYFTGRLTDVIRTGGETVVAADVEHVLRQHPAVRDCAVFGLPDEQWGQVVACALVVHDNDNLPLGVAHLRQWCAGETGSNSNNSQSRLAGYQRPQRVFCVAEIPRNASGKILKYQLRERFAAQAQRQLHSKL